MSSWLLVASIPGLLILAALGLGRLERSLSGDTVTAAEVGELVVHADAVDVHALARDGIPEALEYLHLRQARGAPGALPAGRHALPTNAAPLFALDLPESPQRSEYRCEYTRIHASISRLS